MDRYEAVVKVEEVIKCAQARQYDKAYEILETINIAKIRNYDDLVTFAEVYLKNKKYNEAKALLEKVHEKTSTRRLVALMISVCAKMHNYVEAERYYEEYTQLAPKDVNRFILRYKIDKAKGLNYDILIRSLEQLKEFDMIEEWEYELAKLYHKAGYDDKCISECNTIIMMFGAGVIVEKAKLLRDHHINAISKNTKYSLTGESGADSGFNATVELNGIINQVKEKMAQTDEQAKEIEAESSDEDDYGEEISVSAKIEEEYAKDNDKISDDFITKEKRRKEIQKLRESGEDVKQEVIEVIENDSKPENDEVLEVAMTEQPVRRELTEQELKAAKEAEAARAKEIIERLKAARKQRTDSEQDETEAETEANGIGDESDEFFDNLSSMMNSELDKIFEETKQEAGISENQTKDATDYYDVDDDEDDDDIGEDDSDIGREDGDIEEDDSDIDEDDGDIDEDDGDIEEDDSDNDEDNDDGYYDGDSGYYDDDENMREFEEIIRREEEKKAELKRQEEERNREAREKEREEQVPDILEKLSDKPIIPDYNNSGIDDEELNEDEYNQIMNWLSVLLSPMTHDASNTEDISEKIFRNYYDIPNLRSNVRCTLQFLEKNRVKGNYIICGQDKSGKTTIAKMIAKTSYMRDIVETSKVARIDACKFNEVDLEYKQDKLADGCLIIQRAHLLTRAAMTSLITMIVHLNGRIVVFLETDYENIAKLYVMTKEVRIYFTNIVSMPEYTKEQLLGFAKSYAAYKNYSFSEAGLSVMEEMILKSYDQLEPEKRIPYVLTSVEKAIRAALNRSKGGFGKLNSDGLNLLDVEDVEQQYQ